MLRKTLVVALAATSVLFGSAAQAAPARSGDLISVVPSSFKLDPAGLIVPDVNTWKVLYHSKDAAGADIAVSGTVLVPRAPFAGVRPIVGHAIGTHGLGDDCAPSKLLPEGSDYEGLAIKGLLDRGWAVAVTDYQGLGTPGDHTYVNGRAQGQAVLDSVRAAMRLPAAGLSADAPVGISGYSQGGQSASWAGELHPWYAPELKVKGVSIGAAAADLKRVAQFVDGMPSFGFGLAAAVGLSAGYAELDTDAVFNDQGRALVEDIRDDCTLGIATKYGFKTWAGITSQDPFALSSWSQRLDEQLAGLHEPAAPVRLYHSTLDDVIPFDVGTGLKVRLCAAGADVDWDEYHTPTHIGTFFASISDSANWLGDRFGGVPATNDC